MTKEELQEIISKYLSGEASVEEKRKLQDWYMQDADKEVIVDVEAIHPNEDESLMQALLFEKIKKDLRKDFAPVRRMRPWKWVAAASIILVLGLGSYFLFLNKKPLQPGQPTIAKTHDVPAPQNTRAVITLADGSKVYLDSAGNGTIAQQDNVNVVKNENGAISYQLSAKGQQTIAYNTLTNPRGSKVIDMQLSDGSHVWLNAGSSVTYPVAFVANQRKVEITGEAYFEVAHDAARPFIVSKGDVSVEVLGTHFNVNAYNDEDALRVTLLEGSVRVGIGNKGIGNKGVVIKPGEQAIVGIGNKELGIMKGVDLDEVMAWKNGRFLINGADIGTVMRELARWYDIQVVYKGEINEKFRVGIDRSTNVSNVFKILEATGAVHFTIEGRTVTVMP